MLKWPEDYIVFRVEGRSGKGRVKLKCSLCSKRYTVFSSRLDLGRGKFCSKACSNKYHASRMTGKILKPGAKVVHKCDTCGKNFVYFRSARPKVKCCSVRCHGIYHGKAISGENHPLWLGGTINWRGTKWKYIRKNAIRRDKNRCLNCGRKSRLQVHHIVPYRISKDNRMKNLKTLCLPCHVKEERALCRN